MIYFDKSFVWDVLGANFDLEIFPVFFGIVIRIYKRWPEETYCAFVYVEFEFPCVVVGVNFVN